MKLTVLLILLASLCCLGNLQASCCWNSSSQNSSSSASKEPKPLSKKEAAKLKERGGVIYEAYGEAWHPIRYQKEFGAAQWKTILLQKRVRVPLTAQDQRALLKLFVGE